ncbi:acyltransferase family protein [Gellertiella hungarica]|uniref:Peptidoglycan/LPS O-acetylase OafA/YrhL n=1 Tax=Gellertiella hungarica TaxID=1572859 RepID=A0A7W6J3Q2_9HYPH|nr:acyltransferase [Gellertiella hungarica]MBB4064226.1 peptidoglycan/LPS O-acetylase OafA/YrhL [Gellertiella hungarica]
MQHIKGFNALRAFSVILVIVSHVGIVEGATTESVKLFFSVFNANYGAKTFFVLSGFLITTLLLRENDKTGTIKIFNFFVRRALRIFPLYFLVLAVCIALAAAGIAKFKPQAFTFSLLFLGNYTPPDAKLNYLSHFWSLAVEEQFYLFWPFVSLALLPHRYWLGVASLAIIGLCLLVLNGIPFDFRGMGVQPSWTIPAIYPIICGCFYALIVDRCSTVFRSNFFLGLCIAIILLPLATGPTDLSVQLSPVGIGGFICWVFLRQESWLANALEFRPLAYLGTISYGLYVWQGILTGNGTYRETPHWPPDVYLGAALTLPAAMLSFHYFEQPISRLRRYFGSTEAAYQSRKT